MPNKKTAKRNRSRSRKGGLFGFFESKPGNRPEDNPVCQPNNINNLISLTDQKINYNTCCPKKWFQKNKTPYCLQLDTKIEGHKRDCGDMNSISSLNETNDMKAKYQTCCPKTWYGSKNSSQYCTTLFDKYNTVAKSNEDDKKLNRYGTPNEYADADQDQQVEEYEASERDTLVTNPIQQKNQYNPIPNQEEDQRPSVYAADDDIPPPPVNAEGVPPVNAPPEGDWKVMGDYKLPPNTKEINTEGGKRRKTKKHFKKRSIRKRSIRKRSIKKRKGRKH